MRHVHKQGFTLVELLVVIAIIGTLVGLLLPAVQSAREAGRANTCRNNLKQLQMALAQRESSLGDFPGYINNLGTSGTDQLVRASWAVTTFPYIEQQALWEVWNKAQVTFDSGALSNFSATEIENFTCPSNPPVIPGAPNLAYAANAGWIGRTHSLIASVPGTLPGDPPFQGNGENPGNAVFFDRSRLPDPPGNTLLGPSDALQGIPPVSMTIAYIQSRGDGTSNTILLSEKLQGVFWAHNNEAAYTGSTAPDEKYHFGICWEQPDTLANQPPLDLSQPIPEDRSFHVNGNTEPHNYSDVGDMRPRDAYPSSFHPGGVNVAFVGGSVRFVADALEPVVYGQLMTSNRNNSDLNLAGTYEKFMAPLDEGKF